jgi:hypothetical protein
VAESGQIRVLLGTSGGSFSAATPFPWGTIYDMEIADVDRNGIMDVIATDGLLDVFYGTGTGSFGNFATTDVPAFLKKFCVSDFDRDGFPDVAVCDGGVTLRVFWGSANPPFSTYATSTLGSVAWDIQAGQAESDGMPFLYVTNQAYQLVVLKQGGTPGAFSSVGAYDVNGNPEALALGLLNGDGGLDAVVANSAIGNISVLLHGSGTVTSVEETPPAAPRLTQLRQNYPNPFNPETTIRFTLAEADRVRLNVYDVQGRIVARLVDKKAPAGENQVRWVGRNDRGEPVASGVYFYRLTTDRGFAESKRMIVMK